MTYITITNHPHNFTLLCPICQHTATRVWYELDKEVMPVTFSCEDSKHFPREDTPKQRYMQRTAR